MPMTRLALLTSVAIGVGLPAPLLAADTVLGTASVYDTGDGSTPSVVLPLAAGVQYLSFAVTGVITYNGSTLNDADGAGSVGSVVVLAGNGRSGISAYQAGFLSGVFLDASGNVATTPTALTYPDAASTGFAAATPLLNQVFFIGDGLTGHGIGTVQQFFVPTGATRLLLGFADAPGYAGSPGSYGDNTGALSVISTAFGATGGVPEPLTWALLTTGFGIAGTALRRRRGPVRTAA